ncbi:MAG: LamB/YcsF family protein, partial [Bacteroidota bacterium]|nr:LamB/YcsF family protein [Bacteroidota bacterium]
MTKIVDINCDMGESYYENIIGNDSKIMKYVTSCNIACGFHGGDPNTIRSTVEL